MLKLISSALLVALAWAAGADGHAQGRNAAYIELLGNGGAVSVNYERALMEGFAVRGGVSYVPRIMDGLDASYGVPLMVLYRMGERRQLEVGLGILPRYRIDDRFRSKGWTSTFYTATVGYRHVTEDGMVFRLGFTPINGHAEGNPDVRSWWPWIGLSVGPAF